MGKAKEISALWKQIKPQIGELARLCREIEDHYEVTADAYQRGYEAGLKDAKEGKATCQFCEYQYLDDTEEPCKMCCRAYTNKYRPKKQEERIQVGDEVISEDDIKATVIDMDDYLLHVLDENGVMQGWPIEDAVKTDRHFPEIAEVLRKMREDTDG